MILEDLLSSFFYSVDATIFVTIGFLIIITKGIVHFSPSAKKHSLPIHILGLLVIVIATGLSSSIVAGKGYDSPYFVYVTNTMKTQGISIVSHTDKPLTFLVMYSIGELFNVPGRLSVPFSGIFFACLFVVSTYIISYSVTKDFTLALVSSLIAMQSSFTQNLALNFIGNLFGLCLMYLGLYAFKEKKYALFSPLFILLYFAHRFTFAVGVFIIAIYQMTNMKIDKKMVPYLLICALGGILFLSVGGYNNFYIVALISDAFLGNSILKFSFYDFLQYNWLKDSLLMYLLYALGMVVVISDKSKFTGVWVSSIFLSILVFPVFAGRILLYLPFPILGVLGLKKIANYIQRPPLRTFFYVVIFFLFMYSTVNYYNENKITNLRYIERGPFVWDTVFIEEPQLIWISENYNLTEIIVLTDIDTTLWGLTQNLVTHPDLKPGVHYRIMAEIGTNIFVGSISDLIQNGYRKADGYWKADWAGYPIFGPQNISLEGKTLLVPDTIYNLEDSEMDLLEESNYPGIYLVREDLFNG